MSKGQLTKAKLPPSSSLLVTESRDAFNGMRRALNHEMKPRGIIEEMYVAELGDLLWEILRLRRCKLAIINSGFRAAVAIVLMRLRNPDYTRIDGEAQDYAEAWFFHPKGKEQVAELLSQYGLDESAIEAEAMRQSGADLDLLDRMLASLESRRTKALRCLAEYRGCLARQLHESCDRIIEGKVLALDNGSSKERSAAA
jgi:hypothetical protein